MAVFFVRPHHIETVLRSSCRGVAEARVTRQVRLIKSDGYVQARWLAHTLSTHPQSPGLTTDQIAQNRWLKTTKETGHDRGDSGDGCREPAYVHPPYELPPPPHLHVDLSEHGEGAHGLTC